MQQANRPLGRRRLSSSSLVALAWLWSACAPSDFDALVGSGIDGGLPCDPASAEGSCPPEPLTDAMSPSTGEPEEGGQLPDSDAASEPPEPWDGGRPPCNVCRPNEVREDVQECGNCGKQTRVRSCNPDGCAFGPWRKVGNCVDQGVCKAGDDAACDPADSCGHRVCSSQCTWSECMPRSGAQCLRRRFDDVAMRWQEEGSNYMCCADQMAWRFCLPSCMWAASCAPCDDAFCECGR